MIKAFDLKKGRVIQFDGDLYSVHEVTIMSKGNWRSYIQAKLKNIKTGRMAETRFSTDDRIETPFVETKDFEYLYRDGKDFVVMDKQTFDQIHISDEVMSSAGDYLKGNETISLQFIDGKPVACELPNTVELAVADTPPGIKGATATNQMKEATLETGLRIKVPPFIEIGEVIRVDTRSGEYLERA